MDFHNKDEAIKALRDALLVTGLENQPAIFISSDYADAGRIAAQDGTNMSAEDRAAVVLSNDPATSAIPPAWITFENLQQMKDFGGVPDAMYQGPDAMEPRQPLPAPFNAEKLKNVSPEHEDLCLAFQASIYGDSGLVRDYEGALNEKRFPMTVPIYTFDDLIVSTGTRLEIRDETGHGQPIAVVCNSLTIESGGLLVVETNCTLSAGDVAALGSSATQPAIIARAADGDAGKAGNPGTDFSQTAGAEGNAGSDNKNSCKSAATEGGPGSGGDAANGLTGSGGAKGANANDFIFKITGHLRTPLHLLAQGGKGGPGGQGGQGGGGGQGGRGGSKSNHCSCGRGGQGGTAGKGGQGGRGGQGGDGGGIYITYARAAQGTYRPEAQALGGQGGAGGAAGKPGRPGPGGKNGDGTDSGRNGSVPSPDNMGGGASGGPGRPGVVYFNGNKIA